MASKSFPFTHLMYGFEPNTTEIAKEEEGAATIYALDAVSGLGGPSSLASRVVYSSCSTGTTLLLVRRLDDSYRYMLFWFFHTPEATITASSSGSVP